ncbi:hypothetical protein ACQ1Z7_14890, partial [Enterococcus faecalis]
IIGNPRLNHRYRKGFYSLFKTLQQNQIPYHLSKDDKYSNLIIVKPEVHILIHATKEDTIQRYMTLLNLNDEQVKRLNKLRLLVRNTSLHY